MKKSGRRNLSVTVPDWIVQEAKRIAKERGTSVSAMFSAWVNEQDRASRATKNPGGAGCENSCSNETAAKGGHKKRAKKSDGSDLKCSTGRS